MDSMNLQPLPNETPKRSGFAVWACLLMMLSATGCSTNQLLKTWNGPDLAAGQVGILHAPADVEVVSVNGKDMTSYLLKDLALNYQLYPGVNQVLFKYRSLWAKTGRVDNGESKADLIESALQQVTIDVQPGADYTFAFSRPADKAGALVRAESFKANLLDANQRVVAASVAYVAPAPQPLQAQQGQIQQGQAQQPLTVLHCPPPAESATVVSGQAAAASPATSLPTSEGLKVLWEQATSEEKKEFLRWAFK